MPAQGGQLPEGVAFTAEEARAAQDLASRQAGLNSLQNAYAAAAVGFRYGDHQDRELVSDRQKRLALIGH